MACSVAATFLNRFVAETGVYSGRAEMFVKHNVEALLLERYLDEM